MKPFARGIVPKEETETFINAVIAKWEAGDQLMRSMFEEATPETIRQVVTEKVNVVSGEYMKEVWINDVYQVAVRDTGKLVHLSIRRLDRQPIHDWRDFQSIKNQIVGPENEAVELYPAESRVVDTANQYHVYVVKDPKYRFPFGFNFGKPLKTNDSIAKAVQRPIEE